MYKIKILCSIGFQYHFSIGETQITQFVTYRTLDLLDTSSTSTWYRRGSWPFFKFPTNTTPLFQSIPLLPKTAIPYLFDLKIPFHQISPLNPSNTLKSEEKKIIKSRPSQDLDFLWWPNPHLQERSPCHVLEHHLQAASWPVSPFNRQEICKSSRLPQWWSLNFITKQWWNTKIQDVSLQFI